METSLPSNWFVLPILEGKFYINYHEKLLSIEPPFQFRNINLFLCNYNLLSKKEEIIKIIKSKCESLENQQNIQANLKKKEVISELEKEEVDEVDSKELENVLRNHIKSEKFNDNR